MGLQEQLPITIKSGCATRGWTPTEQRATSIEKSKDELAIVLAGRNRLYLLSAVNLDLNRCEHSVQNFQSCIQEIGGIRFANNKPSDSVLLQVT